MLMTKTERVGNRRVTRFGSRQQLARRIRFMNNDTTAFVPEKWAQESVRLLWEKMIYAGTVHRDFEDEIAEFGDIVHTRKISNLEADRKQNDLDNLATQDITATKIQVALNQRVYNTFVVGDGERSKSFQNLIQTYLEPAIGGCARFLDRCVGGQVYQFLGNLSGGLGLMSDSTGHGYLLDSRQVMNDNAAPDQGRYMGLASNSETMLQKHDLFKSAERRGDGGEALRNAMLGRVDGFDNFLSLNTPSVRNATKSATTTLSANASAGATSISAAASVTSGQYITVAGDMTPLRVTAVAGTGPYTLTLNRALLRNVTSSAVIQPYASGLINQASSIAAGDTTAAVSDGYPAGWMKGIVVDGTGVPKLGQMVSFKAVGGTVHSAEYCIVRVSSDNLTIWLDRPLEDTVANDDIVDYGPDGDYNFFYQRGAVALVNRPLALPEAGTGARGAVATFNNMSLRIVMTYDGLSQGTRITVDGLFGIKKLENLIGGCMLG